MPIGAPILSTTLIPILLRTTCAQLTISTSSLFLNSIVPAARAQTPAAVARDTGASTRYTPSAKATSRLLIDKRIHHTEFLKYLCRTFISTAAVPAYIRLSVASMELVKASATAYMNSSKAYRPASAGCDVASRGGEGHGESHGGDEHGADAQDLGRLRHFLGLGALVELGYVPLQEVIAPDVSAAEGVGYC